MAWRWRWWVVGGALVMLAVVGRCGARQAAKPVEDTRDETAEDVQPRPTGATSVTAAPPAAAVADRGVREPERPRGTSDVAQVLRATDEHDRTLLADIERRTSASPPKAVHELIAMRHAGAPREELERFIAEHLGRQLLIRVAAQRWLRTVMPRPGLEGEPRSPRIGQGGGTKLVQPIERVER